MICSNTVDIICIATNQKTMLHLQLLQSYHCAGLLFLLNIIDISMTLTI